MRGFLSFNPKLIDSQGRDDGLSKGGELGKGDWGGATAPLIGWMRCFAGCLVRKLCSTSSAIGGEEAAWWERGDAPMLGELWSEEPELSNRC